MQLRWKGLGGVFKQLWFCSYNWKKKKSLFQPPSQQSRDQYSPFLQEWLRKFPLPNHHSLKEDLTFLKSPKQKSSKGTTTPVLPFRSSFYIKQMKKALICLSHYILILWSNTFSFSGTVIFRLLTFETAWFFSIGLCYKSHALATKRMQTVFKDHLDAPGKENLSFPFVVLQMTRTAWVSLQS